MKKVVKRLVISQIFLATIFSTASYAQQEDKRSANSNGGDNRQRREINPAFLDKYPGVGRQEDFQRAMKEERAGWRLMMDKKWDLAINKFKQATQIYPTLPAAYVAIGQAIERSGGASEEAETAYRTAIKLDSDDYRAWHKLGGVLYTQKKYVEASKALHNAISLNPPAHERKIIDRMITLVESAQNSSQGMP